MGWIKGHKLLFTLMITILILVIVFVVSIFAGPGGNGGASVWSGGLTGIVKAVKENVTGLFSYRALQSQVEELEAENLQLQRKLTEAKLTRDELDELKELSEALNFEYTQKEYTLISADIVTMDGANWTNIFTINRGSEAGIKVGDAVVNGAGLVGRVESVGKKWAKVTALIDEGSSISFKLARDRKQLGIANGDKKGEITGFMMHADSTVSEGDIILTSGLGTYPEGLEVGNVKTVKYNSNTLLKEITVEPAANFKELDKVAVLQ